MKIGTFYTVATAKLRDYTKKQVTLSVGQRRDLAVSTLRVYGAKPSGRIFSDQNSYCLEIYYYVFYFFILLPKQLPELSKRRFVKCRLADFQ